MVFIDSPILIMQKIINNILFYCTLTFIFFFNICISFSENIISDTLYPSRKDKLLYEVGDIIFEGNSSFTPFELIDAVSSKKSSMSIQHDVFQYYYENLRRNPSSPKVLLKALNTSLNSLSHEFKYFNEGTAELDAQTLWHFYNTNGFHDAKINYSFLQDKEKKYNILKFIIEENDQYKIDTLLYLGLDNIDPNVTGYISAVQKIRKGDNYNERKIMNEINSILTILLNNGYFYASLIVQPVSINPDNFTDSLTVQFLPGKRQRIAHLTFVDSLNGQNEIVESMKLLQLEFSIGDWYNRSEIQSSINNMNTLGAFELVSIDTSSVHFPMTDTTLSIQVFTKYRKQKEWSIGTFVNNTQIDNFTNFGIEASVMHRNWGGAAQSGNIFANARIKNVSRILSGQNGEYEGQVGIRFAQPIIWSIENMKIGVNGSLYYSLATVDQLFNISSWFLPIRFPIKLSNDTYLNQILIDFNFEFQNPTNYLDVANDTSTKVTTNIIQALFLYKNLYDYLNSPKTKILTSNLFGITLIGDSRNHPFSPSKGDYFYFMIDGWNIFLAHPWISGIAKFLRTQATYNFYVPATINTVLGFKFRAGVIDLADDYDSYIPFERQFFAGGANSVRGWLSRELHYSPVESDIYATDGQKTDLTLDNKSYNLLSNILGSSALIEGSVELRYTLPVPKGIHEVLAEQISKIGFTFFVDYGNTYHWYASTEYKMKWYEYFTKMAWAAGVGIRYNTPIGPIRLDFGFPVYRPGYSVNDYYIWKTDNIFSDMKVHFGIGHSF
jgi:outer membrane protein assembly factor BamA